MLLLAFKTLYDSLPPPTGWTSSFSIWLKVQKAPPTMLQPLKCTPTRNPLHSQLHTLPRPLTCTTVNIKQKVSPVFCRFLLSGFGHTIIPIFNIFHGPGFEESNQLWKQTALVGLSRRGETEISRVAGVGSEKPLTNEAAVPSQLLRARSSDSLC